VLPTLASATVLDVACGTGRWARHAVDHSAAFVAGVDFSPAMLARARAKGGTPVYGVANMACLPFANESFDVVTHALALSHDADPVAPLREAARVLTPGGALALVDVHPTGRKRGWRRTFRTGEGSLLEVLWQPAPLESIVAACVLAGLVVDRWIERRLDPRLLPRSARRELRDQPAVYALRATKWPTKL
jgi:ubiquinone/menaquinone biosynthesis C-methylase UbiE